MGEFQRALVTATDLRRSFGPKERQTPALISASFTLGPGQHLALVGPSGSGKSTLLALMAGLDRPDGGTIEWPGLSVRQGRPQEIAVAFQAPSLVPSLSIAENVALPLLIKGSQVALARKDALTALALFDVDGLAEKLPEEISGGQAQRAVLARAVASRPKLLLADEPTGQLDQMTAQHVIDALLAWSERADCTLVIATHDLNVASRFTMVWEIRRGELLNNKLVEQPTERPQ